MARLGAMTKSEGKTHSRVNRRRSSFLAWSEMVAWPGSASQPEVRYDGRGGAEAEVSLRQGSSLVRRKSLGACARGERGEDGRTKSSTKGTGLAL